MSAPILGLQSLGPKGQASSVESLIHWEGQYACENGVIFEDLDRVIHRHLLGNMLPSVRDQVERWLLIQGPPGTGKTVASIDASLRLGGFAVAVLPPSLMASEFEGGPTDLIHQMLADLVRLSAARKVRFVVVFDDFDLSIVARDADTSATPNHRLLMGLLQHLADNRSTYRNHDGTNIAFIATGNDFTVVRSSMFRDGRATTYTHAPDAELKLQVALYLFQPRTSDERAAIEKLARIHAKEPVAFWRSLKNDLDRARLDALIERHGTKVEAIEAELSRRLPLNLNTLAAFAKARAGSRSWKFA